MKARKYNSAYRLRQLMELKNINQRQLSIMSGISESGISQYLSGKREPNQLRLALISNAFHVSPSWLMGFDVPMADWNIDPAKDSIIPRDKKKKKIINYINNLTDEDLDKVDKMIKLIFAESGKDLYPDEEDDEDD